MSLLFAAALLAGQASESDWIKVAEGQTGTFWLLRRVDISNEVDKIPIVWVTLDYSSDKTQQNRSAKRRFRIDCEAATYEMLATIEYDVNGQVAYSHTLSPYEVTKDSIAPDTVTAGLAKAACPTGSFHG